MPFEFYYVLFRIILYTFATEFLNIFVLFNILYVGLWVIGFSLDMKLNTSVCYTLFVGNAICSCCTHQFCFVLFFFFYRFSKSILYLCVALVRYTIAEICLGLYNLNQ